MHTYTRTGTVTHVDTYPHMKSRPPAETHAECIAPQAIPAILAPPPCRPSLLADAATTNAREAICVGDCRARRSCRPSCPLPPAPQQNRAPSVAVTHRVCCDAMDQRLMSATTTRRQALLIDHKARRSPTDTNKGGLTAMYIICPQGRPHHYTYTYINMYDKPTREASPLGLLPQQQWAAHSMIPPPRAPACQGLRCALTPQSISEMITSASEATVQ